MDLKEIKLEDLEAQSFIERQCQAISSEVGDSIAINALSGGVDSSVVSMLGHRALGDKLKTCFIDNGIMREGEPEYVVSIIEKCGVPVELVDAQDDFFDALKGKTDPEEKRHAITESFYKSVFGRAGRGKVPGVTGGDIQPPTISRPGSCGQSNRGNDAQTRRAGKEGNRCCRAGVGRDRRFPIPGHIA